jgi:DNA repair protein SbcD/Mre11
MAIKLLHFADAHIDMSNYGRRNPQSGLPYRVEDYLAALDFIVDTAIERKVDLVIFAGDAYKDRTPAPTFQREWGKRIMRLSAAAIPSLLLVGNHDNSPALGRASTLQEFDTLDIPHIRVIDEPSFLSSEDLGGIGAQVIGLPWIARSQMLTAALNRVDLQQEEAQVNFEKALSDLIEVYIKNADPELPLILTAHGSVMGAKYGRERSVMLGGDFVIARSLVCDPRLDYVALGHIHKPQSLNDSAHPPVIYPGSIEKIDFGEIEDTKYCIFAEVDRGITNVEWIELPGRKFIDRKVSIDESTLNPTQVIISHLPSEDEMREAVMRLIIEYPEGFETQIDQSAIDLATQSCFDFRLVKRTRLEARIRLSPDNQMASMLPIELLEIYLKSKQVESEEKEALLAMAKAILSVDINEVNDGE